MILPVYVYGHSVLKQTAKEITKDYPELTKLINDMWETMYNAQGIGLAAPQIGKSIRLFIIDTTQIDDADQKKPQGIKQVFINAQVIDEAGEPWLFEEGCLSIPNIRGDVSRQPEVTIEYQDLNFITHRNTFKGINARVIQHEYDHTDGILFTEKLKPMKKRLVKRKLENMKKGNAQADYKLKFASRN